VPAAAFHPPPKVASAVVAFDLKAPQPSDEDFLQFASFCFRQKRKTLRNNLSVRYTGISQQPESGLRAEQLSIAQLRDLHARLTAS
jgi:16S rRNA A1518/A1519 N6-dimethyltransferase RsmA/KsgA/DIM1 with predicted DNA glycosylase/AP lyase activity